jgi:thioredoxin 2
MSNTALPRKATVSCQFCQKLNRVNLERGQDRPRCGQCGKPIPMDRPIHVSDHDLDRVLAEADVPVLVDFYADWCQPCKIMAPLLDELASGHAGRALIAKLDTDRNPAMAQRFQIRGIPTLIVFYRGREVAREVGAVPRQRLQALLERASRAEPA